MNTSKHFLLLALLCTSGSSTLLAMASVQSPPVLPPGIPNPKLWVTSESDAWWGSIVRSSVADTLDMGVRVDWSYRVPESDGVGHTILATSPEFFPTRFWPTRCLPVGMFEFCVAGKRRTGEWVVERWVFDNKTSVGTPAPACLPVYPTNGGPVQYTWSLPPRLSAQTVLENAPNSPRGAVRGMTNFLGAPHTVVVYYEDSRELWKLELATGLQTLMASPTTSGSALVVPGLANGYEGIWSAERLNVGYCYFFPHVPSHHPAIPSLKMLVLQDNDKNGTLDAAVVMQPGDWESQGWGVSSNYVSQPVY